MNLIEYILREKVDLHEKPTLNKKIWTDDGKMQTAVRSHLLRIGREFLDFVNVPSLKVKSLILTGSLANYTWHELSDLDLHVLVDVSDVCDLDSTIELFASKKSQWNDEHDITIHGFPVELYIQPVSEKHASSGIYDITKNEWMIQPKKVNPTINDTYVTKKAGMWKDRIDTALKQKPVNAKYVEKLKDRLREMRKMGLDKQGEFAVENLVYKILRSDGYIQKMFDVVRSEKDDELSL